MTLSMGTAEAFFGKWRGVFAWNIARGSLYEILEYIYMHHVIIPKNTPQGYHTNQRLVYLEVLLKPARGIKLPIVDTL